MDNKLSEQFGLIYDQYIEKIYRFVYLKVSSQETAEDITSKAFIKAWEKFKLQDSSFKIQNINAFLYRIANNLVIDHYRAKGRDRTVSHDSAGQIADASGNPFDLAVLNADMANVAKALKEMDQDQQNLIIWHYLEDMPILEMAKILEKEEGTVRVALHRALKELRRICNKNHG